MPKNMGLQKAYILKIKMKTSKNKYIKIVLVSIFMVGLFIPYSRDVSPFAFIFDPFWNWDLESLFTLQIPLLAVIPLFLLLLFKNLRQDSILKAFKVVFLLVYLGTLVEYFFRFYDNLNTDPPEVIVISISVMLSLILYLLSLKYSITKLDALVNTLIAIMALPIFLFFVSSLFDHFVNTNYGFYILNGSFISLYVMSLYNIYKNRYLKKSSSKKEIIT